MQPIGFVLVLFLAIGPSTLASALSIDDLAHQYSFSSDASDSRGSADLDLIGNASVSGGVLDLVDSLLFSFPVWYFILAWSTNPMS